MELPNFLKRKPEDESVINVLKIDHLKRGIKPITAWVASKAGYETAGLNFSGWARFQKSFGLHGAIEVLWGASEETMNSKKFLHAGQGTYVISNISNEDKFSEGFSSCIALFVVGKKLGTDEDISFLSHQFPESYLNKTRASFLSHIEERLNEMKAACEPGTIDAIMAGGDDYLYKLGVSLLTKEVEKTLGFQPTNINGAKEGSHVGADNIYCSTGNRQVYLMREKINDQIGIFTKDDPGTKPFAA